MKTLITVVIIVVVAYLLLNKKENKLKDFVEDLEGGDVINGSGVLGCTDSDACNYDIYATLEDNKCTYPEIGFDCQGVQYSFADINQDGSVSTQDLLLMLSMFGTECDNPQYCPTDLNQDGGTNVEDLLLVLADFGLTNAQAQAWMQQNLHCDYAENFCIV